MKKKKIIAILMIVFGILLIGGAFIIGEDEPTEFSDSNNKPREEVYYDPSSPESIQINLMEKMKKINVLYKDIKVTDAYVYANPGINTFDGHFINNSKKDLKNLKMIFILYDNKDKEIYRFRVETEILAPGEEAILRAETMTYLGDVVRFEIIDA